MPAVLTQHSYGKSRVRLTQVTRLADRHEIRELTSSPARRGFRRLVHRSATTAGSSPPTR